MRKGHLTPGVPTKLYILFMTITSPDGFSLKSEEERLTCINPQQQLPPINQHTCPVSTAVHPDGDRRSVLSWFLIKWVGILEGWKSRPYRAKTMKILQKGHLRGSRKCAEGRKGQRQWDVTDSSGFKKGGYTGHCQKQLSAPSIPSPCPLKILKMVGDSDD